MNEDDVLKVLQDVGAFRAGHFVFTSGLHASTYINKDAIYPHTHAVSALCKAFAEKFKNDNVEAVIGPAYGAIILSTWTAYHLTDTYGKDVWGVYADKVSDGLVIRRGYDKLISGKRTLIVEDITTTGGSLRKVIDSARAAGADVIGAAVIANRGHVTRGEIGNPPRFEELVQVELDQWPEEECALCKRGIPVNTDVAHGADFMKKK